MQRRCPWAADAVALAIAAEADRRDISVRIVRNGSRGMLWLEPLVEIATTDGRVAYGPVAPADVPDLFDADFLQGGGHALGQGLTEEIDYLKRQERVTFARCGVIDPLSIDDYKAHGGFAGLEKAISLSPAEIVKMVTDSGLRGRGGFILMTSRCSFELVQNTAIFGSPYLATVSAPTSLALDLAEQAGMRLASLSTDGVVMFDSLETVTGAHDDQ